MRPSGRTRTRLRDYISHLAWSRLGVELAELSEMAVDCEVFRALLKMLPLWAFWEEKRVWKWLKNKPSTIICKLLSSSFDFKLMTITNQWYLSNETNDNDIWVISKILCRIVTKNLVFFTWRFFSGKSPVIFTVLSQIITHFTNELGNWRPTFHSVSPRAPSQLVRHHFPAKLDELHICVEPRSLVVERLCRKIDQYLSLNDWF